MFLGRLVDTLRQFIDPFASAPKKPQPLAKPQRGIVIGAGIAGIAAARKLHDAGYHITVLEARDRVGGRIWTDKTLGVPVDIGASWIQGTKGNPITRLSRDIKTVVTKETYLVKDGSGNTVSDDDMEHAEARFEALYEAAEELAETLDEDISIGEAVRRLLADDEWSSVFDWTLTNLFDLEYGASADTISLFYGYSDDEFPGKDVVFPGGYVQVIDLLAESLDIRPGYEVEQIHYDDNGVRVTTDNETFEADFAIVTVPLGVLKSGKIVFSPPLPATKQAAINGLEMALLNKVVLRFPHNFWGDDHDYLGYVSSTHGEFPLFLNMAGVVDAPVLVGFVGGDYAVQIENLPDEDILKKTMDVLCTLFGDDIPQPESHIITRWGQDEHTAGSYSYIPVGATQDDRNTLAHPAGKTLFFAGEATHAHYPSTVHGAYLSGIREAERILTLK
ncbi:MAG: FAD-dependent oxidoreductase [Chloroflexota bacterium]